MPYPAKPPAPMMPTVAQFFAPQTPSQTPAQPQTTVQQAPAQQAPPPPVKTGSPQPLPMNGVSWPMQTQFYQFNPTTLPQIQTGNPNAISPAQIVARNAYTPVNGINNPAGQIFNQDNAKWNQFDVATAAQNQTPTGIDSNMRLAQMMGNQSILPDLPRMNKNGLGALLMGGLLAGAPMVANAVGNLFRPNSGATATSSAQGGTATANSTGGQGGSGGGGLPGGNTGYGGGQAPAVVNPALMPAVNPYAGLGMSPGHVLFPGAYTPYGGGGGYNGLGYNIGGNIQFGGPVAGYGGGGGYTGSDPYFDPYTAGVNQTPGLTGALQGIPQNAQYDQYNIGNGLYGHQQSGFIAPADFDVSTGPYVVNPPAAPTPTNAYPNMETLLNKYPNFLIDGKLIGNQSVGGVSGQQIIIPYPNLNGWEPE